MPLAEFATPEISEEYLQGLPKEQLVDLLQHKTKGLLTAARLDLSNTANAQTLGEEVKRIQREIAKRDRKE